MRHASAGGLLLCACGRLGFDPQAMPSDGGSDGGVDQAAAECGGVDQDTVALYTFDDALGTDATGAHPASLRGTVAAATGRCGDAAAFDGSYLLVPDSPAFDLATGSIELFVRLSTTATADNQVLLARDAIGTALDGHFSLIVTPNAEIVARLQVAGEPHNRCLPGFPTAQWVHVGLSFGGVASQGLRLWVDGADAMAPTATLDSALIDCTTSTPRGLAGNDNTLVIGASNARHPTEGATEPTTTQHVLGGEIDHVHIRSTWRDFGR